MWLHRSVGRASHRYRGGHGFESLWSLDFLRLLLSNCLNWKICCDDHSSLWTIFTLMLLNGLLVLGAPNFRNRWKKCLKENWMFLWGFCTSVRNKDCTLLVYKSSSMKSIWEPPLIVSFARYHLTNRFSLSLTPRLPRHLHWQKTSEKQATLPAY